MVLQVLTYTGLLVHHRNGERAQQRFRADSRELEQLWTLQSASAKQNRFSCLGAAINTVLTEVNAGRALAIEVDAGCQRAGFDAQIGASPGRSQVSRRGAAAPTLSRRQMVVTDSLLRLTVEVIIPRQAEFLACRNHGFDQLMLAVDGRAP